jgi:hypothetical protein
MVKMAKVEAVFSLQGKVKRFAGSSMMFNG